MNGNIDRKFIERINELDDSTLQSLIMTIAQKSGGSEKQAMRAASNVSLIRKKISKMSDAELNKAIESAGEDKVAEIMQLINTRNPDTRSDKH